MRHRPSTDYARLFGPQGTLTPLQEEYKGHPLFVKAVASYTRAQGLWQVHLQAIALGVGEGYTLKKYVEALQQAELDMAEFQIGRGVHP